MNKINKIVIIILLLAMAAGTISLIINTKKKIEFISIFIYT